MKIISNEVYEQVINDITFCINGLKNEYACTDERTRRELHLSVQILTEVLERLKKLKNEI